ncbi:MAG: hypothetical protein HYX60_07010 [Legionella longbeachae]|nr:hypothetical protein [Legionella longbeachae]
MSIGLQCNKIRAEGAEAILKALKINTSVTEIDLQYNTIGQLVIKQINESLKNNKDEYQKIRITAGTLLKAKKREGNIFKQFPKFVLFQIISDSHQNTEGKEYNDFINCMSFGSKIKHSHL